MRGTARLETPGGYLGGMDAGCISTSCLCQRNDRACTAVSLSLETLSHPGLAVGSKELIGVAKQHCYLLAQMVPAVQMVRSARFRYSTILLPWTDSELDQLYKRWLQVYRAA